MNDPTVQSESNGLHVALGGLFVTIPAGIALLHPHAFWGHWRLFGNILGVTWGMVKEFWYDNRYESLSASGGWWGDLIDFGGYLIGMAIANIILI